MSYTTKYTSINSFMQDAILDIDIMDEQTEDLFDVEDPLFPFDSVSFESSKMYRLTNERRLSLTFARRLSITSVFHEVQEYQEESLGERDSVQTLISENGDCSSSSMVAKKTKARQERQQKKVSPPGIISLLTSAQLEQQLEHTKARLTESMERSAMSRKRLNDEVDCSPEEHSPRRNSFNKKAQRPNSAPASVLSQSRARFASYMNSGINISSQTL